LAQHTDSINCVLVEPSAEEKIPQSIQTLHNALQAYDIPRTTTTITAILTDSIDSALAPDKENIIIFNTEKYTNLKMLMPHLLHARATHNNITLYSHYSWQNEKIILPQIYTSAFKCDYVVPEQYTEMWQQYFTHELTSTLPRYDVLGYDLTYHLLYILQAISTGDTQLPVDQLQHIGIQSAVGDHKSVCTCGFFQKIGFSVRRIAVQNGRLTATGIPYSRNTIGIIHRHTPLAVGPFCSAVCVADTPHTPVVVIKDTVFVENVKVKGTVVDERLHI
jgi:hypothetical protein